MSESENTPKRARSASTKDLEAKLEALRADMDDIMKALGHKAEEEVAEAKGKIGETAEDLMSDLRDALKEIRKQAGTAEQVIETNTREHPFQSLLLAFGLGFLISLVMRR
jgi:ElaB/YqjD/DUF883 family membrane-anchored ribosome-binding protein